MRRSVKYGLYGAVLATVVGGTAAAATTSNAITAKSVTLVVDGSSSKIDTTADSVHATLADAGYRLNSHDLVAPAAGSTIHNGTTIVLRRGRLLHLFVDGQERDVWTTAPTVSNALTDLGYPTADFVSVSRSQRLPLQPTAIELRSMKMLTFTHDGTTQVLTTTDETVGQVVSDQGVVLRPSDRISPALSTPLASRMHIVLERITDKQVAVQRALSFGIVRKSSATMYKGDTKVLVAGAKGLASYTYDNVYVNGQLSAHTLIGTRVLKKAKTKVEEFGTKSRPAAPASTSGLNWQGVANCESGGNWHIDTGNGFYGGLQFDYSTWLSNGGGKYAKRADLASKAEQIDIANHLYARRGSSPWPVCGRYL